MTWRNDGGVCAQLAIVDLEGNNVEDPNEIESLNSLVALTSLTLQGNPVAAAEVCVRDRAIGEINHSKYTRTNY